MRRLLHLSAALFSILLLLLAGLNAHVYLNLRQAAIAEELADVERQAEIRAQEIENALQSVQFALEKLELLWAIDGGNGTRMFTHLKAMEHQLAYVRALSIVGPDGTGLHSSRAYPVPPINVASFPTIAYHLENGPDKFSLGAPTRSSIDNDWQLPLSMAVRDADGTLRAIIVAIIDPRAYSRVFESAVAPGDYVTLLTSDFKLVARYPWLESEIGESLMRSSAYQAMAAVGSPALSGIFDNPFTGELRIAAVRKVFGDRLVISSSRPLEAGIAGWRSLATIVTGISLLILLLGAGASYVMMRMLADRDRRARALAQLNVELQDQTAHAERLATVKSEFLATMSHEIRTPMNGVLGMAQALEKLPLDPTTRDYVSVIRDSAESLLGIINDILDFSRLEAGRLTVSPSAVRLFVLMESMSSLFAPACTQKQIGFRTEILPGAPPSLETDPVRIRQILVNLIGNAVKFTGKGEIVIRALPTQLADGRPAIRIEVRDTGAGIAPEALGTIFDRFVQEDASTSRRYGGTGLGLAISSRLCTLLGGTIGCDSEKGVGSCFWIELPVDMDEAVVEENDLPYGPALPQRSSPPRVLCVDDNHVNRRIIDTLLKPFCATLAMASSGPDAIAMAAKQEFDVVLLDIHMPGMDGVETQHRLRALPGGRGKVIVALTADVVPEAVARYEVAGFDAVVAKPVELAKLLGVLGVAPAT